MNPEPLTVPPQLASWDRAGHPSQVRLAEFLTHVETVAARQVAGVEGRLAMELVVGLPEGTSLATGGRDLDNYLYPVAQRLGAIRLAAAFGRKTHGPSSLAIGPVQPDPDAVAARFVTRMAGSYERDEWKQALHDRLLQQYTTAVASGPLKMVLALTTGGQRNWANLWKPLVDAFGPVLGEDPHWQFHPNDDRIVDLAMHHSVDAALGHDVVVEAWWTDASAPPYGVP
ncbi:MAG TPA: hypothetical protein VFM54_21290 [Micromonosporaceae bacterium]|nr:hypothetical protein [Micromonosporaceae bacterium]